MEGHLSRKVQGPGYQGHDLKGVVQVLGRGGLDMGKTCLGKCQRGSKACGPIVCVMQK